MRGWETLGLAASGLLILVSAVLAVAETSLSRLSRARSRVLAEEEDSEDTPLRGCSSTDARSSPGCCCWPWRVSWVLLF